MSLLQTFIFRRVMFCRGGRQVAPFSQQLVARSSTSAPDVENTNVGHSWFLAEASARQKWKPEGGNGEGGPTAATSEDFDSITEGKGKLSTTSSHLFKLILPLGPLKQKISEKRAEDQSSATFQTTPPTIFLLHPSQPLSHVGRLILSSLTPATAQISFRYVSPRGHTLEWSESTDVGNFIRDAARATEFEICITGISTTEAAIRVEVPTFADRTRFLRRRLALVEKDIGRMEGLKHECDVEAHRGARRMAVGGFGILVVYWGAVARLTFWDYGWDVMEPVTYLSSLSMVILGYSWFLYQGREVSYSSVLQRSISARRETLYKARGLDIERWLELVSEARGLRREIGKIAEDYDEQREREKDKDKRDEDEDRKKEAEAQRVADTSTELAPDSAKSKAKAET